MTGVNSCQINLLRSLRRHITDGDDNHDDDNNDGDDNHDGDFLKIAHAQFFFIELSFSINWKYISKRKVNLLASSQLKLTDVDMALHSAQQLIRLPRFAT